jgi:hypothetical protein
VFVNEPIPSSENKGWREFVVPAVGEIVWTKPKGVSVIMFTVIAPGGAGGGGESNAGGNARIGGAGGGAGAITRGVFLAYLLPDILILGGGVPGGSDVPQGGAPGAGGGASGGAGEAQGFAYVRLQDGSTAPYLLLLANGGQPGPGGDGTGQTGGVGGVASAATAHVLASLGTWLSIGGLSGGNSSNAGVGGNASGGVTIPTPLTGGSGGGGASAGNAGAASGAVLSNGLHPGLAAVAASGVGGTHGLQLRALNPNFPLMFCGGVGGSGHGTGTGGDGGHGTFGCGGGGGGAGVTGGRGGNGGPGLIIVSCA